MTELEKLKSIDRDWEYHFRASFSDDLTEVVSDIEYFLSEEGYEEFLDRQIDGCDSIEATEIKKVVSYFVESFNKLDLKKLDREVEEYYKEEDEDE